MTKACVAVPSVTVLYCLEKATVFQASGHFHYNIVNKDLLNMHFLGCFYIWLVSEV